MKGVGYISAVVALVASLALLPGCFDEEFSSSPSDVLSFSVDSLRFDTVFTTMGTATQNFKVYNRNYAHVASENHKLAFMRIDYGASCLKQLRRLNYACLEGFQLIFRPLAGIGWQAFYLAGVQLKVIDVDFSDFHDFDVLRKYRKSVYNIRIFQ